MTTRHDLLVLTDADLADISNRGTVKRATKELDRGTIDYEMLDDDGTLTVRWSDGPTCILPADATVAEARCDCPAMTMCRHIIRSVLAYQRENQDVSAGGDQTSAGPWSPGDITGEMLAEAYSSRMLSSLRDSFDAGLVTEVIKSEKPVARFHKLRHTVRFLVPGDVRYTQCDCAEKAPCRHAALAVWAFRLMNAGEDAALLTTGPVDEPVDETLLDECEAAVRRVVENGLANTPTASMDRLHASEQKLRDNGVIWPAEILHDFRRQYDHYHSHDARFSPDEVADLLGELIIRFDALRNADLPVPELFVRGHRDDTDAKLGQTRLIGLGCGVRHRRNSVEILALLQDDSSGTTCAVRRHFPDPPADAGQQPEDLARLGRKLVVKGRDLATIGAGQLVIKKGKLRADHHLSLGRSTASVYAQDYRWEDLRAPVYAESFAEVQSRLAKLPPASLRPRRLGENLHVVAVAEVRHARFASRDQAVRGLLCDNHDKSAELFHPYTTRNRYGTERLLHWLTHAGGRLRYVAGHFRLGASGLLVQPTALIFQKGDRRTMVQPWVDDMDAHMESSDVSIEPPSDAECPLEMFRSDLAARTGDAVLTGMDAAFAAGPREWDRLTSLAERLNLFSVAAALGRLREAMQAADYLATSGAVLNVAVLSRLAQELG